jgi:hypothetical protein
MDLKDALEALLGCQVDLVELRAVRNRRLRDHIEETELRSMTRPGPDISLDASNTPPPPLGKPIARPFPGTRNAVATFRRLDEPAIAFYISFYIIPAHETHRVSRRLS